MQELRETKLASHDQQGGTVEGVNKETLDRNIEQKQSEVKRQDKGGNRGGRGGYNKDRGNYQNKGQYHNQDANGGFNKGQGYKQNKKYRDDDDNFKISRPQDSELKKKLLENAKQSLQAARGEKDDT